MLSELIRDTFSLAVDTEFGRSLICPGGLFEVVEDDVLGERMAVFKNRETSIFNLLRASTANNPDGEYLADGERRLTYRKHMAAVANLSRILREEHGVRRATGSASSRPTHWNGSSHSGPRLPAAPSPPR